MPRTNRHILPGLVWRITYCCHRRESLLKFARDTNTKLEMTAPHCEVGRAQDYYALREPVAAYVGDFDAEIVPLSAKNSVYWDTNDRTSDG
jgi:hypothetical protein